MEKRETTVAEEPKRLYLVHWDREVLHRPCPENEVMMTPESEWPTALADEYREVSRKWFEDAYSLHLSMRAIAEKRQAYGLAAPQVGVSKRLVIITDKPGSGYRMLVHPTIIARSPDKATKVEGCLSYPGLGLRVKRSKRVTVEYTTTQEGKVVRMRAEFAGTLARVVQHEIDHLNGKTIADRCVSADRDRLRRWLRKQGEV